MRVESAGGLAAAAWAAYSRQVYAETRDQDTRGESEVSEWFRDDPTQSSVTLMALTTYLTHSQTRTDESPTRQYKCQCSINQQSGGTLHQFHVDQGQDKCQDGPANDQWVGDIQIPNGATGRVRVRLKFGIRLRGLVGQSQQARGQAKLEICRAKQQCT